MPVVDQALDVELLEHLRLVGVGRTSSPERARGRWRCRPAEREPGRRRGGPRRGRGRSARTSGRPSSSNVAPNFLQQRRLETADRRTFHSTPSRRAARERLVEPTYAVSKPVLRRNSQDLAWSRVRLESYWTRPRRGSRGRAGPGLSRSVAPMYVVVMIRSGTPRARASENRSSRTRRPYHLTKAMIRSTRSAFAARRGSQDRCRAHRRRSSARRASERGVEGRSPLIRTAAPGADGTRTESSCRVDETESSDAPTASTSWLTIANRRPASFS